MIVKRKMEKYKIPDFSNSKKIQLNAYVPPKQGDKKMMSDYISAGFNSVLMTEDFYDLDKERDQYFNAIKYCGTLGLDVYILGNSFGVAGTLQQRDNSLSEKVKKKCGLGEWTWNSVLYPDKYPRRTNYYEKYFNDLIFSKYPEIKGINIVDEPPISQLYELKAHTVPWFNEKFADGNMSWDVNFFPPYVELGTGFGTDENGNEWEYSRCVEFYLSEILPFVKSSEKLFGMDYYALRLVDGERIIESGYLKAELENAIYANKYGAEPSAFIQVFSGYSNWRQPCCVGEVRLQMNLNLAFGAKKITYYSYRGGYNSEKGVINLDRKNKYRKSKVYHYIKVVNNEILKVSNIFASFHFEKIHTYYGSKSEKSCEAFDKVKDYVENLEYVDNVKCKYDVFITQLRDNEKNISYMIVNYDKPFINRKNKITLKFNGEYDTVLCVKNGKKYYYKLRSGDMHLRLSAGVGVLLIPIYRKEN